MNLPNLLLPYDLYERHAVVSKLLKKAPQTYCQNITILDVGGRAKLLERFIAHPVISLNIDGSGDLLGTGLALPFRNQAFFAVVSIDTLEHLPPNQRLPFLRECLRVTKRYLIVAAPFGSVEHIAFEKQLDSLYRSVYGKPHLYLAEHIRYGLPSMTELNQLVTQLGAVKVQRFFAGDYVWQGKQFEYAVLHHKDKKIMTRLKRIAHQLLGLALFHPIHLQSKPSSTDNRFYLLIEKKKSLSHN